MKKVKKTIVFLMKTSIIAEGLLKEFDNSTEYDAISLNDYQNIELYLSNKSPKIILIEVPDHSSYSLGYCLEICRKLKDTYKDCKIILFISYTYLEYILPEVIEAKREGDIDAFTSANIRIEELLAHIKALG